MCCLQDLTKDLHIDNTCTSQTHSGIYLQSSGPIKAPGKQNRQQKCEDSSFTQHKKVQEFKECGILISVSFTQHTVKKMLLGNICVCFVPY